MHIVDDDPPATVAPVVTLPNARDAAGSTHGIEITLPVEGDGVADREEPEEQRELVFELRDLEISYCGPRRGAAGRPRHRRQGDHRVHRPVRVRQDHGAAFAQPACTTSPRARW